MPIQHVRNFLQQNPFLAPALAFLLGGGAIWSYLGYVVQTRNLELEQLKAAVSLHENLLTLHAEILAQSKSYIEARDAYFNPSIEKPTYEQQNEYSRQKARFVQLVSDYDALEARLCIMEERQPRWFVAEAILPPIAPKLSAEAGAPGTITYKAELRNEEAVMEIAAHLRLLFKQYGQDFDAKPPAK